MSNGRQTAVSSFAPHGGWSDDASRAVFLVGRTHTAPQQRTAALKQRVQIYDDPAGPMVMLAVPPGPPVEFTRTRKLPSCNVWPNRIAPLKPALSKRKE